MYVRMYIQYIQYNTIHTLFRSSIGNEGGRDILVKHMMTSLRISEEQRAISKLADMSYAEIFDIGIKEVLKGLPEKIDRKLQDMETTIKKYSIDEETRNQRLDDKCLEYKQSGRKIDDPSKFNKNWVTAQTDLSWGNFVLYYKQWMVRQEALRT